MTDPLVAANPLHDNPLASRDDVVRALLAAFAPLVGCFSPGRARVTLGTNASVYDRATSELEAFARPLWGIAPFAAGGGDFPHWDLYREGLTNGTDPDHPEYWGDVGDLDQRMVEIAAIGLAIRIAPQWLWEPLSHRARTCVTQYLLSARAKSYHNNNWKFFRVLTDLGLEQCGADFDRSLTHDHLDILEGFYIGDGWYRDGNQRQVDHYIAFAMHFYSLIYAMLATGDEARRQRFRDRAAEFAPDLVHWFAEDGAALAFGRSLTYRFACCGFWGALAFAGIEALPWGEIKGHYLRHLRWWSRKPISDRDGVLSIGYGYPNLFLSESYNAPGSPYWAFKAFLPLALPAEHPFWAAQEADPPAAAAPVALRHPGMVTFRTAGNVVALSSGQHNLRMRAGTEKYAKFAYSSRYAFSIEVDERGFVLGAFDGTLALSDDERHTRVRETCEAALIAGTTLYSRWQPWADVTVETWLVPAPPWHLRVHRIATARALHTAEGGFAVARHPGAELIERRSEASVRTVADIARIVDLAPETLREGLVQHALPNTNILAPQTFVPQLRGELAPGTHVLACAVMAVPASAADGEKPPPGMPDLAALEARVAAEGLVVSAMEAG